MEFKYQLIFSYILIDKVGLGFDIQFNDVDNYQQHSFHLVLGVIHLVLGVVRLSSHLGQDSGGFMNDGAKIAKLFVREIPNVWEFERLEREALRSLDEGLVDVLVGDALAGGQGQGAVRGEVGRLEAAGRLPQSL